MESEQSDADQESKEILLSKLITSYRRGVKKSYTKDTIRSLQWMLSRVSRAESNCSDFCQTISDVRKRKRDSETLPPNEAFFKLTFDSRDIPAMSFRSNQILATRLLKNHCYHAAINAVLDVKMSPNTFLVIDAPSGTGKTLFGIALRLLDFVTGSYVCNVTTKMRVVHCIWTEAATEQVLYVGIRDEHILHNLRPDELFKNIKSYRPPQPGATYEEYADHVWNHLLAPLFSTEFPALDFKRRKKEFEVVFGAPLHESFLVLYIDEVPTSLEGVKSIIDIREACKPLKNVVVVLAGTNAKASNMIGMNSGSATTNDVHFADSKWALLMTRLPWFRIEYTDFKDSWNAFCSFSNHSNDADVIVKLIQTSMTNGGNQRFIVFALQALFQNMKKIINIRSVQRVKFEVWQKQFCDFISRNKFVCAGHWKALPSIIGQANLMLRASSVSETSDILIGGHFAMRSVPIPSSAVTSKLRSCAGWLHFADDINRCLGYSLYYVPGKDKNLVRNRRLLWQTTVFASPESDPLLYVGSCRSCGFLSYFNEVKGGSSAAAQPLTASRVLPALWRSNGAGFFNFQNETAIVNTGSRLEVGLALAICNAASLQPARSVTLFSFLQELMTQLGMPKSPLSAESLQGLNHIKIPRMLFPYKELPSILEGYAGFVKRMGNKDKCDLLVSCLDDMNIRVEAKDRNKLTTDELVTAAEKLFKNENERLGILVVRNCCDYWSEGSNRSIRRLHAYFQISGNVKQIKHIIFVRDGFSKQLTFGKVCSERTLMVILTNLTDF